MFNSCKDNNKEKSSSGSSHTYSYAPPNFLHTKLNQNKRSQSALEYMMTYGWAILIIVIVAVILYSMGIFNPSSAVTTTSSGFSPFAVSSVICSPAGLKVAVTAGGLPNNAASAQIMAVYFSSTTGTTANINQKYSITPVTLSSGYSTVITVPTVACTSTGTAFSLSTKLQYSYSSPAGNVVTNATGTIAGTSSALKITAYVPLTISSSAATPQTWQQLVVVNMSNYKSYASSTLDNLEFTYPNGSIIPSWRENGTSNTQVAAYFLKLGSFTSTTVHMDFFPISDNVLNTVNTGEAPQLTCSNPLNTASCNTYAEYDNGNYVFNYYQNFKGTTYPAGWTTNNFDTTKYVEIHNGFTIEFSPVGVEFYYNRENFSLPAILDWQGSYIPNPPRYCGWTILGWYNFSSGDSAGWAQWINSPTSWVHYQYGNISQAAQNFYNSTGIIGNQEVFSLTNAGTSMGYLLNYTLQSYANPENTPLQTVLFRNGAGCGPTSGSEVNVTWLDVRAYPPSSGRPSVSFGSVS